MMSPVIDDIAKELEGNVKVGKVNVDNNQELAIKYDVMSIPTIMVFEKGNPVKTFVGVTDKQEILDVLKSRCLWLKKITILTVPNFIAKI